MAREMVAMWRTVNGPAAVPGVMSHPASDATESPTEAAWQSARPKCGWRKWIPTLERTPPLVQFLVRLARWVKAKSQSEAMQAPQFRLVGQLALGGKRHLSLVEVGGVQFLVGGGVEHVTVIATVPTAGLSSTENLQGAGRPHSL